MQLDRANALKYIALVNGVQDILAPIYYRGISSGPVPDMIQAVASGRAVCEITLLAPDVSLSPKEKQKRMAQMRSAPGDKKESKK